MNPAPLVSIIINNYNYEQFLPIAIESVLNQEYQSLELIVVDDCSTDHSRQVIERYANQIIPVFHTKNGKQGAAFNSGFAKSQGEIILFLDADDYLYPGAIAQIVKTWKPDLAKVHYRLDVVNVEGQSRCYSYPQGCTLDYGNLSEKILSLGTYSGVPTSGNAISRKALQQVMPIPTQFNTTSDDYLSVLIPLYGAVVAIESPLGAYRIHGSNQWALSEITSDRFHRFIHHDLQRCELLKTRGKALGYDVPENLELKFFGRVWARLSSLKYDRHSHPIPTDTPLTLAWAGIRALWQHSDHPWQKRVLFSVWFLWVGILPPLLAKPAITWLYAPQLRPKLLTQLKALVS